jgi:predicted DNA binding CopG/RHH family protein
MATKDRPASAREESEEWDQVPLEKLLKDSEPLDAIFVDRRKPKQAISMRVDPDLIVASKRIAIQLGLGYQTLFRLWLMEGLGRYYREYSELTKSGRRTSTHA